MLFKKGFDIYSFPIRLRLSYISYTSLYRVFSFFIRYCVFNTTLSLVSSFIPIKFRYFCLRKIMLNKLDSPLRKRKKKKKIFRKRANKLNSLLNLFKKFSTRVRRTSRHKIKKKKRSVQMSAWDTVYQYIYKLSSKHS